MAVRQRRPLKEDALQSVVEEVCCALHGNMDTSGRPITSHHVPGEAVEAEGFWLAAWQMVDCAVSYPATIEPLTSHISMTILRLFSWLSLNAIKTRMVPKNNDLSVARGAK